MLKKIVLKGYKSIRDQTIELSDINLLIGANGVGKSNFLSFFQLLNHITNGNLQNYVAQKGGANTFLYGGAKKTRNISVELYFEAGDMNHANKYELHLSFASGGRFFISEEQISWFRNIPHLNFDPVEFSLKAPTEETDLIDFINRSSSINPYNVQSRAAEITKYLLENCKYFHLHDTSDTANIKQPTNIQDTAYLYNDCGNLSAFLLKLKNQHSKHYERILRYIRAVMPQFGDFELIQSPADKYSNLNWRDRSGNFFDASQISDGSLRFMGLATLLLQPETTLPKIMVLDEPELGLHPKALQLLRAMIEHAKQHSQLIIATQSAHFLDEFTPEQVIVAERQGEETIFKKLSTEELKDWLDDYTLSGIWDKNLIGGQP
jgi:predicted ATPase